MTLEVANLLPPFAPHILFLLTIKSTGAHEPISYKAGLLVMGNTKARGSRRGVEGPIRGTNHQATDSQEDTTSTEVWGQGIHYSLHYC